MEIEFILLQISFYPLLNQSTTQASQNLPQIILHNRLLHFECPGLSPAIKHGSTFTTKGDSSPSVRPEEAETKKELAVEAVTLRATSYTTNKQEFHRGARQVLENLDKIYK